MPKHSRRSLRHREKAESWMRIQDRIGFDALNTCDVHRLFQKYELSQHLHSLMENL